MTVYQHLALLYVEKNAKPNEEPEKLFAMYNEAYDKIFECAKDQNESIYSFE